MLNKQGLNDEEKEEQSHTHLEDSSSLGPGDSDPECGDGEVMVREAALGLSFAGWRRSRRGHCQPGGWRYGPGIMEGVLGQYRGGAEEAGAAVGSWVPVDLGAWAGPCLSA